MTKWLSSRFLILGLTILCGYALNPPVIAAAADNTTPAAPAADAPPAFSTIHNDFFWVDQNGARINTRCGDFCQFNGLYYWYGGTNRFRDQTCYVSSDLMHWTYKGVVLHTDTDANRICVLYNEPTKTFVMFLKYDSNSAFLGIATSPTPDGQFTFQSQTLVDGARIGDMSMYKDTDGTAYLCYVWWHTGVNRQHGLYRMSADYLTLDKRMYLWDVGGREAPHMFKRNGIYYYGTSRTAGIRSSATSYCTATNLEGPWTEPAPLDTPGSINSWDTQVDFVYPFQGPQGTVYMFAGDRWIKNGGRQGDYAWLPMEFDGDKPIVHYNQDWDLNISAGAWRKFDPARNLAAGKTATASSANGANIAAHATAPKTYENYADIRWESAPTDAQWISIDLGAASDINRVILKWFRDYGKSFKIQTSTDAANWTDVYTTTLGAPYSVTDVVFPTTSARYVRMLGVQRGTTNGYSLFDFAVLKD